MGTTLPTAPAQTSCGVSQATDQATVDHGWKLGTRLADRWLGERVQRTIEPAAVRLELWDGSSSYAGPQPPIGDFIVTDRRTLLGLALNPELWFGESYMAGRLLVRGPLEEIVEALTANAPVNVSWQQRLRMAFAGRNSVRHSRHNVHHHYDLGNPFYQLWLDRELVYTCAYFADPGMSLEAAQIAKLDLVCRKLHLRPGERVVEAGCGFTVAPESPQAVAQGLRELATLSPQERRAMGERGKRFVVAHHGYPVLARRFLEACGVAA